MFLHTEVFKGLTNHVFLWTYLYFSTSHGGISQSSYPSFSSEGSLSWCEVLLTRGDNTTQLICNFCQIRRLGWSFFCDKHLFLTRSKFLLSWKQDENYISSSLVIVYISLCLAQKFYDLHSFRWAQEHWIRNASCYFSENVSLFIQTFRIFCYAS